MVLWTFSWIVYRIISGIPPDIVATLSLGNSLFRTLRLSPSFINFLLPCLRFFLSCCHTQNILLKKIPRGLENKKKHTQQAPARSQYSEEERKKPKRNEEKSPNTECNVSPQKKKIKKRFLCVYTIWTEKISVSKNILKINGHDFVMRNALDELWRFLGSSWALFLATGDRESTIGLLVGV